MIDKKVVDIAAHRKRDEYTPPPPPPDKDLAAFIRVLLYFQSLSSTDTAELKLVDSDLYMETRNYTDYTDENVVESGQCLTLLANTQLYDDNGNVLSERELVESIKNMFDCIDIMSPKQNEE